MKKILLLLLTTLFSPIAFSQYDYSLTKNIDSSMRLRVDFWKRVYTEITSKQAFIHDKDQVRYVYKKIDLPYSSNKRRARYASQELKEVKKTLRNIVRKERKNLSTEETRLSEILKDKSLKEIKSMANRIRYQYGLKDNYYIGLKRSYLYMDYIESVLKEFDIPQELRFLPHVESSFNYQAYSKVGAAGIWQFMRGTARNYRLNISYSIDDRRDVFKSTRAAASLLKYNYSKIKVWPLAITAYNHGLASMTRAVKKHGTTQISEIIKHYEGRRFGFASQNFYATFLATAEISANPENYFPAFKKPKPLEYSLIQLPKELTVAQIRETLKLSNSEIQEYNPAIRSTAYRSPLYLPKSFDFRLPKLGKDELTNYKSLLANSQFKSSDLKFAGYHNIRSGDSLYSLSKVYRVSVDDLIQFNKLANPSKIFPGMKIKIPTSNEIQIAKTKASTPEKIVAKVEPQLKPEIEKGIEVKPKSTFFDTLFTGKKESLAEAKKDRVDEENLEEASKLVNLNGLNLELVKVSKDIFLIQIEPEETIGHYADWAGQVTQKIRNINKMKNSSTISLGQKIKIQLDPKEQKDFITKRAEYHLSIQEDFYQNFRVNGLSDYKVKRGDSINKIIQDFNVPFWLFKQTQPKTFSYQKSLFVGQNIKIPVVVALEQKV